jgi:thiol:disulfide interchange protein
MRNRRVVRNLFILVLAMVAVSIAASWMTPRDIIAWRTDFHAGLAEARASGKPALLYFTADWCEPCKRMKRSTWADPAVKSALAGHVPVKIDIDDSPALAERFGVKSVPRLIVLDDRGQPTNIRTGFTRPGELIAWIQRALDPPAATLPTSQPPQTSGNYGTESRN